MQFSIWERIILANEQKRWDLKREMIARRYTQQTQQELKEAAQKDPDEPLVEAKESDSPPE